MDAKTFDTVFGPLDRKYCNWFLYLTILAFVFIVLTLVTGLAVFVQKGFDVTVLLPVVWSVTMYGIFYFQNRILYSMCMR